MSTIHSQQDQSGSRIEIIANHLKPVVIRQENPINAQDALSFASLGRFVGLPLAKAPPRSLTRGKNTTIASASSGSSREDRGSLCPPLGAFEMTTSSRRQGVKTLRL